VQILVGLGSDFATDVNGTVVPRNLHQEGMGMALHKTVLRRRRALGSSVIRVIDAPKMEVSR
jgi:hypothetical protein